jgi:hypothetical protein
VNPWAAPVICVIALSCSLPGREEPAAPRETDEQRLLRETRTSRWAITKEIVSEKLIAPSQADFSDRKLIEQERNFALNSVVVDAPNAFGVKLRQTWCVVVRFDPPRGETYAWHRSMGAWDCSAGLQPRDLLARKMVSGWPGSALKLSRLLIPEAKWESHSTWVLKMASETGRTPDEVSRWLATLLLAGVTADDLDKYLAAALDLSLRQHGDDGISTVIGTMAAAASRKHVTVDDLQALKIGQNDLRFVPSFRGLNDDRIGARLAKRRTTMADLFVAIAGERKMLGAAYTERPAISVSSAPTP